MGRRRKGNRRNRSSEAARAAAKISAANLEKRFEDTLKYQKDKTAQSEYLRTIADIEQDILSRSIFVTQVKDLKRESNLAELKRFFEVNYGRVEECVTTQFSGRRRPHHNFPPARVRFFLKQDAEKIFGKELMFARTEASVDLLGCAVAHGKGPLAKIKVRPSDPYPNMVEQTISESHVEFRASSIALGHWFSMGEEDSFNIVSPGDAQVKDNLWLEEKQVPSCFPSVKIDLCKRTVEIELHQDEDGSELLRFMALLSYSSKNVVSFRFKDLLGPIEFFPAESALFFRLKHPPKLFKVTLYEPSLFELFGRQDHWDREVELCGIDTCYFGGCLGYKLTLDRAAISRLQANREAMEKMRRFGIWENMSIPSYVSNVPLSIAQKRELDGKLLRIIDFQAGLLLRTLLDNGNFCWYHVLNDRMRGDLSSSARDIVYLINGASSDIAHRVLRKMGELHGQTRFPASVFSRLSQLEYEEADIVGNIVPSHCVELPRVLLTPTRVAVVGFQVEMSNRVTRKYVKDEGFQTDCFLRLSIGDENGDKLFFDQLTQPVESRISDLILSGITINGRKYRFLAYSSSQLKELSLWMVAPPRYYSVTGMRSWMGDFSKCKTPSKYAARMGQCFSTTVQTLASRTERAFGETQINVNDNLSDVVNYVEEKEMCHSDGTGIIRKELMTELLKRLPFAPADLSTVSIIQIRFGGAKGTLTAWDISQLRAARKRTSARGGDISGSFDVHLRPSMVKFEAPYRRLEVVSIGAHIPYYLNRNVILLLGVHGVRDSLFLEMQRVMLDTLDRMLRDAATAAEIAPRLSGPDSTLTAAIVHMVAAGLSPDKEPFLFSALHAIRTHHLTNLRKKSRIFVRDGAVLIGGMDETGLVAEGCVFVQVRHGSEDKFQPLLGPLMVTKHPVMHPGDVRMLLGVDVPELRDHKNVVLFSQWGIRREADKMAGSDLDGDQFAVTWDSRLFLKEWNCCKRTTDGVWISQHHTRISLKDWKTDVACLQRANAEPMDYTAPPPPPSTDDAIGDKEVIQHFINHAKADNLGRIANMWLDYAAKNGADCKECCRLAELHSIAVDFPKSGVPAEIPKDLSIHRDVPRPHWRERKDAPSYHCTGVVGRLYDEVVDRGSRDVVMGQIAMAGRVTDQHGQILCFVERLQRSSLRLLLERIYQPHIPAQLGWKHDEEGHSTENLNMLLSANVQRRDYDGQLMTLMNKYHLHSEGELLTGCIRKYHRLNKRRQHDLSEEVKSQCRELRKIQRRLFFEEVISLTYPQGEELAEEEYDELLMTVERMVTDKMLPEGAEQWGFLHDGVRQCARKLAAAMYMVTYNPDMRLGDNTDAILFSFPWVVADVIAHGVNAADNH